MAKITGKKSKLPFQFEFLGKTYKDHYNYEDFLYNATIFLRNKYPFLPLELLTARAKDEWNKKKIRNNKRNIVSKDKRSRTGNGHGKKKPLAFEAETNRKIRSKPKRNKLFAVNNFETTKQSMISEEESHEESHEKSTFEDPEIININDESSSLMEDFLNRESSEIVSEQSMTKCSISDAYLPIHFDGDDENRLTTTIEEVQPAKISISESNIPLYLSNE
ncbi:uncharacterized protein LOC124495357 [Dermatophagoides farinae]|uniref:Uncharacterized protein n=1 Tax=Dermatophagoides farinae TaxID=6954 RepID=A0A922L7H3_DERFA|nr:uncharacterized protein LOC124495357 [Dermatophagoides farinae]KAH7640608.1 hypothetical protein HUG17_8077 [Dermatophagoides farinae]KAH9526121.1 hypothetical protein DERF_000232 [Dermatophagoides farinae]